MKINKIISAVAAISMLSSLSFTVVNAEHATNPIIHVYVTEAADIKAKDYYKVPDGYTPYMVSYSVEGIDTSLNSCANITIDYTVSEDDLSKVDTKSFTMPKTSGPAKNRDLNGVYNDATNSLMMLSNKQIAILAAGGFDITDWDVYPNGGPEESMKFIDTLWYVKDGESITIKYNTEVAADGQTSSQIQLDNGSKYSSAIEYSPATITLGKPSTVAVTGVSIKDKADFTLDLNGEKTKTLEAVVAPADATNKAVKWSSDNEKAATVVDGKVTAVGEGEAKITVTTVDGGFTDSVKVTVKDTTPPEKPIVDVTPSKITGDYGTKTLKYIAKIVKNADATAFIKVTKTLNGKTESKETTQTIAELLGGVATEGTLVSADVAIGVLTADTDAVFSFGLVK